MYRNEASTRIALLAFHETILAFHRAEERGANEVSAALARLALRIGDIALEAGATDAQILGMYDAARAQHREERPAAFQTRPTEPAPALEAAS